MLASTGRFLTIFLVFITHSLLGHPLFATGVFPTLVYYETLNFLFLHEVPVMVAVLAESIEANDRMQAGLVDN